MAEVTDHARERNLAIWEAGDWDEIADHVAAVGPRLLQRIGGVGPGVRLLDVGTGSGGAVAIPAARHGADVVGADVTDAWFAPARRRAKEANVTVEWVVADAAAIPFADASFDVVTSTFAHMLAPDQTATARELVRVCRPGGTIGLACWTPTGQFARIMVSLVMLTPIPDGFVPPVLWGSEPHVRELLEPLGVTLAMRRATLTISADSPEAQLALWERSFGPMVNAKAELGDARWPAARAGLLALLEDINERDDGTMAAEYEYLETIARK